MRLVNRGRVCEVRTVRNNILGASVQDRDRATLMTNIVADVRIKLFRHPIGYCHETFVGHDSYCFKVANETVNC